MNEYVSPQGLETCLYLWLSVTHQFHSEVVIKQVFLLVQSLVLMVGTNFFKERFVLSVSHCNAL